MSSAACEQRGKAKTTTSHTQGPKTVICEISSPFLRSEARDVGKKGSRADRLAAGSLDAVQHHLPIGKAFLGKVSPLPGGVCVLECCEAQEGTTARTRPEGSNALEAAKSVLHFVSFVL